MKMRIRKMKNVQVQKLAPDGGPRTRVYENYVLIIDTECFCIKPHTAFWLTENGFAEIMEDQSGEYHRALREWKEKKEDEKNGKINK